MQISRPMQPHLRRSVVHHQQQSAHYLDVANAGITTGAYLESAHALRCAATHAAASAASHWEMPYRSRRKLSNDLRTLLVAGYVSLPELRTLQRVHNLPDAIAAAPPAAARRTLRAEHRRVAKLARVIAHAIASAPDPNVQRV